MRNAERVGGWSLTVHSFCQYRDFGHQIQQMKFQIKHKVMSLHVVGEKHMELPVKECEIG